jgi:hypothetical protein
MEEKYMEEMIDNADFWHHRMSTFSSAGTTGQKLKCLSAAQSQQMCKLSYSIDYPDTPRKATESSWSVLFC